MNPDALPSPAPDSPGPDLPQPPSSPSGGGWLKRWDLRGKFREVLHLDDDPWKIAGGLAAGVFIAFSPYYGVHTLLALGAAFVFRLNVAATLGGAWLVIPPAIPFVMAFSLKVGWLLVGRPAAPATLKGASAAGLWARLAPQLWPLVVGTTVVGVVGALLTYLVAHQAIVRIRAARSGRASG